MAKRILIIDDDRTNINLIHNRLLKEGYVIDFAADGEEGYAKAKANKPDLILLDVEMPNVNGYSFIITLRKDEALKLTPVIVLTSHKDTQPVFQLKGVKDYLLKPVNFPILLDKLKTYFQ